MMAARLVHSDDEMEVRLRFDSGRWTIAALEKRNGRMTEVTVSNPAMEAIIAKWPQFKAEVGR